jgi:hypothetical protein
MIINLACNQKMKRLPISQGLFVYMNAGCFPPIEHFGLRSEDNTAGGLRHLGTVMSQLLQSQHKNIHKV